MTERTEALRRFPPTNPQKLVPMTIPDIRKDYDEEGEYEQLAYKLLESPEFWFDPYRIKDLLGLTYWAEVRKVTDILSDKDFIAKARKFYEGFRYPTKESRAALENIKGIGVSEQERLPKTIHQYGTMARLYITQMEILYRSDPKEYQRRKKMVRDAIKERERGKIKTYPDISLTDLRQILHELDMLYG